MAEVQEPIPEARSLPDPPTDGITRIKYLSASLLASTSWDGCVRVHDTEAWQRKLSHNMNAGPLLSLAVASDMIYTGGLNGNIQSLHLESNEVKLLGQHRGNVSGDKHSACSCLAVLQDENGQPSTLISAGWDAKCHFWDLHDSGMPVATVDLPGKAFAMDQSGRHVVIACANRRICVLDVTSRQIVLDRESSLKYQSRCVQFAPDGNSIAIGSVEGRVAIEYLEELGLPATGKKYAFKCHRVNDLVYPVNCIAFHPRYGTFATGGCDGVVVTWDGLNKKKLITLPTFPTSIAALAFNHDGSELAIASSYTFEEGDREHPKDEIFIRPMLENEVHPKQKE